MWHHCARTKIDTRPKPQQFEAKSSISNAWPLQWLETVVGSQLRSWSIVNSTAAGSIHGAAPRALKAVLPARTPYLLEAVAPEAPGDEIELVESMERTLVPETAVVQRISV